MPTRLAQGYTLVELIVVCAIIGLVASLAVPTFAASADSLRLRAATSLLSADIRMAQITAQHEAKRVRLLFSDPGLASGYSVQVANSGSTSESCASMDYRTIKQVDLTGLYRAEITGATFQCLVFEPSGRTAWVNPAVLEGFSTVPTSSDASWIRLFDGVEKTGNTKIAFDSRVTYWQSVAQVTITLDLGQARTLPWICAQVLQRKNFEGVWFPTSIRLEGSSETGDTPPGSWQALATITSPYSEVRQVPGGPADMLVTCPRFTLSQSVRYLRFIINTGNKPLAMDEIHIPPPTVVVQNKNLHGTRTLTINPITGSVLVN